MLKQINMNEQLDNLENPPFKIKIGNLLLVGLAAICSLHCFRQAPYYSKNEVNQPWLLGG